MARRNLWQCCLKYSGAPAESYGGKGRECAGRSAAAKEAAALADKAELIPAGTHFPPHVQKQYSRQERERTSTETVHKWLAASDAPLSLMVIQCHEPPFCV